MVCQCMLHHLHEGIIFLFGTMCVFVLHSRHCQGTVYVGMSDSNWEQLTFSPLRHGNVEDGLGGCLPCVDLG